MPLFEARFEKVLQYGSNEAQREVGPVKEIRTKNSMTTKPLINFIIDPMLLKRIDDFWHKQRFPNRAAAIKWLLDWALRQDPKPTAEHEKKGAKT